MTQPDPTPEEIERMKRLIREEKGENPIPTQRRDFRGMDGPGIREIRTSCAVPQTLNLKGE